RAGSRPSAAAHAFHRWELGVQPDHSIVRSPRLGEDDLRAPIREDELPLLGVLRLVQRDDRRLEAVRGEGGDGPLDAVVGDDRDDIAAPHAESVETRATSIDEPRELAIARPRPLPVPLRSEERTFGEAGAAVPLELHEIAQWSVHREVPQGHAEQGAYRAARLASPMYGCVHLREWGGAGRVGAEEERRWPRRRSRKPTKRTPARCAGRRRTFRRSRRPTGSRSHIGSRSSARGRASSTWSS